MRISEQLISLIRDKARTAVLTGAGISAESGVPTFRGGDGLWDKFDPRELASINAFMRNPKLVWEWYLWRRNLIEQVRPNRGHEILVEMENYLPEFALITQNVDDLHRKAGSKSVIELHGNIRRNKCLLCSIQIGEIEFTPDQIPNCSCGGQIRPDVVWFGEFLPEEALETAGMKAGESELFFSIGTSAEVYPAAELPFLAKRAGAYVVEINLDLTPVSDIADEVFTGKSGEILPEIWQAVQTGKSKVK